MPNPISDVYNNLSKEDQDLLERWGIVATSNIIESEFKFKIMVAKKLEELSFSTAK